MFDISQRDAHLVATYQQSCVVGGAPRCDIGEFHGFIREVAQHRRCDRYDGQTGS